MTCAQIEHKGHRIVAELEDDSVRIRVDGEPLGTGVWSEDRIEQRPALLSFITSPDSGAGSEESRDSTARKERSESGESRNEPGPEVISALRRDESNELYARLETALVAKHEA